MHRPLRNCMTTRTKITLGPFPSCLKTWYKLRLREKMAPINVEGKTQWFQTKRDPRHVWKSKSSVCVFIGIRILLQGLSTSRGKWSSPPLPRESRKLVTWSSEGLVPSCYLQVEKSISPTHSPPLGRKVAPDVCVILVSLTIIPDLSPGPSIPIFSISVAQPLHLAESLCAEHIQKRKYNSRAQKFAISVWTIQFPFRSDVEYFVPGPFPRCRIISRRSGVYSRTTLFVVTATRIHARHDMLYPLSSSKLHSPSIEFKGITREWYSECRWTWSWRVYIAGK